MRFSKGSLDFISSSLKLEDLSITKKLESLEFYSQEISYTYEYFNSIDDYYKPIEQPYKDHIKAFLRSFDSEGIQKIFEINNRNNLKDEKELTLLYWKSDVRLLTDVSEKYIKTPIKDHELNPLFFVSVIWLSWQCVLKYVGIVLQNIISQELFLTRE